VLGLFLLACSGDGGDDEPAGAPTTEATGGGAVATATSPAGSPTSEAGAPPTATVPVPTVSPVVGDVEPDGDRILDAVRTLSVTIGPRVAGFDSEKQAAALIAEWLRKMGYEVRLQEFSIGNEVGRSSSLSIEGPDAQTIPTLPFANSGAATVSGRLVDAKDGLPEEFPADTQGAITLIRRDGVVFFRDKVANAIAAGATGVVIANNEPGILLGSLDAQVGIPVVGISQAEGDDLVAAIEKGPVTANLSVGSVSDAVSYNVIAEPPGEDCETISGGHYDSVQVAPGASDNASGTATVLEIAAVLAHNGEMGANCFVLFGAEEIGLVGSAYYVSQMTAEEKSRLKAMLNFDMVGVGEEGWWVIGDGELQTRAAEVAADLGVEGVVPSTLIRGLSSDHASFAQAGLPVLMYHRWEDPLLHTPEDVVDRVKPQYLEEAARMGIAMLEFLDSGS
jgi:aminopeptidase YwaD